MGFRFRPLIRGFFFYLSIFRNLSYLNMSFVSVPSFGDSFFMLEYFPSVSQSHGAEFPSPHSGILFLYADRV